MVTAETELKEKAEAETVRTDKDETLEARAFLNGDTGIVPETNAEVRIGVLRSHFQKLEAYLQDMRTNYERYSLNPVIFDSNREILNSIELDAKGKLDEYKELKTRIEKLENEKK